MEWRMFCRRKRNRNPNAILSKTPRSGLKKQNWMNFREGIGGQGRMTYQTDQAATYRNNNTTREQERQVLPTVSLLETSSNSQERTVVYTHVRIHWLSEEDDEEEDAQDKKSPHLNDKVLSLYNLCLYFLSHNSYSISTLTTTVVSSQDVSSQNVYELPLRFVLSLKQSIYPSFASVLASKLNIAHCIPSRRVGKEKEVSWMTWRQKGWNLS